MKAFQHLIIKKDANSMQGLLQTLKDVSGKPFEYRKLQSERYADMIFEDRSHVACFKTKRSSLYESTVWMMLRKDELYVTNITSEKNSNLGITNYNFVLNRFFEDFLKYFIDETFTVQMTGQEFKLEDHMPADVYRKLTLWADTCNKDGGTTHPIDYQRWMEFVVAAFENDIDVTAADLEHWLLEDKHWPIGFNDTISKVAVMYEYGIDLLKVMQDEKEK